MWIPAQQEVAARRNLTRTSPWTGPVANGGPIFMKHPPVGWADLALACMDRIEWVFAAMAVVGLVMLTAAILMW